MTESFQSNRPSLLGFDKSQFGKHRVICSPLLLAHTRGLVRFFSLSCTSFYNIFFFSPLSFDSPGSNNSRLEKTGHGQRDVCGPDG